MSENLRVVVLYGSSLFIAGLETCLKEYPEIEVLRIRPALPDSGQCLRSVHADVIIFDGGDDHLGNLPSTTQLTRENPGILIIGLDAANNSLTILSSEQRSVTRSEEIIEAIRRAGAKIQGNETESQMIRHSDLKGGSTPIKEPTMTHDSITNQVSTEEKP